MVIYQLASTSESREELQDTDRRDEDESIVPIRNETDTIEILRSFNLSRRESDVYLGLLRIGPSPARRIARLLGINRVDTYRVLGTLTLRGLANRTLGSPAVYEAARPRTVVKSVLTEMEQKAQKMKKLAPELLLQLEAIEKTPKQASRYQVPDFTLLKGPAVWRKFEDMVDETRNEICGIWSITRMNEMGALSRLSQCEKRGIGVRIVTEITKRNSVEAEQVLRIAEVRHRNGILQGLRYTIVDGQQAEIGVTGLQAFDDPKTVMSIWSGRKDLVQLLQNQFETFWKRSTDAGARVREFSRK